jgi:hypothetical protein
LVNNAQTTLSFPLVPASHNIAAENTREKLAFCRVTLVFTPRDQSARRREVGKKCIAQNNLHGPPSFSAKGLCRVAICVHFKADVLRFGGLRFVTEERDYAVST